jgi:hypothetical protein
MFPEAVIVSQFPNAPVIESSTPAHPFAQFGGTAIASVASTG